MMAAGQSNQAIATQLVVSIDTVKKHVSHQDRRGPLGGAFVAGGERVAGHWYDARLSTPAPPVTSSRMDPTLASRPMGLGRTGWRVRVSATVDGLCHCRAGGSYSTRSTMPGGASRVATVRRARGWSDARGRPPVAAPGAVPDGSARAGRHGAVPRPRAVPLLGHGHEVLQASKIGHSQPEPLVPTSQPRSATGAFYRWSLPAYTEESTKRPFTPDWHALSLRPSHRKHCRRERAPG